MWSPPRSTCCGSGSSAWGAASAGDDAPAAGRHDHDAAAADAAGSTARGPELQRPDELVDHRGRLELSERGTDAAADAAAERQPCAGRRALVGEAIDDPVRGPLVDVRPPVDQQA